MGAWGEGPFDNDTAGDIIAGLMKPVCEIVDGVEPKPQSHHPPRRKRGRKSKRGVLLLASPRRERLADEERRNRYPAARVAVALCLQAYGTDILGGFSLDTCDEALEIMLNDSVWLSSWRDPFAMQRSIERERLLIRLMKLGKERRERIDMFKLARDRLDRRRPRRRAAPKKKRGK